MTSSTDKKNIAITGANGFIGKYLVNILSEVPDVSLRLLVRSPSDSNSFASNVIQIEGDLTKPETLDDFLVQGCIVVNLAYSFDATSEQNIIAVNNLISACKKNNIKRIIHCSTAAVYGRTNEDVVTELSQRSPRTVYGKTKLLIEEILHAESRGNFEYVNLRPTAVYGPEGQGLMKLANNMTNGNVVKNYLISSLFNYRSMNLVHVSNVVAAIVFLFDVGVDGDSYIISEDDEAKNNYKMVERYIFKRLKNKYYIFPPVRVPLMVLSLMLRLLGRDSINPKMNYYSNKLDKLGFKHVISLDQGLDEFCTWYQQKQHVQDRGEN